MLIQLRRFLFPTASTALIMPANEAIAINAQKKAAVLSPVLGDFALDELFFEDFLE